jgi:diguanylate cyclase (GGDEF)-like protein
MPYGWGFRDKSGNANHATLIPDEPPSRAVKARRRGESRTRLLPAVIVGLLVLVGLSTITNIVFDRVEHGGKQAYEADAAAAAVFQSSLINAETGVRGYVLSGRPDFLEPYQIGIRALDNLPSTLWPMIDAFVAAQPTAPGRTTSIGDTLAALRSRWETAIQQVADNQRERAAATLVTLDAKTAMDRLRTATIGFLDARFAEVRRWDARADQVRTIIHAIDLSGATFAALAMIYAFGRITRAIKAGFEAREQTERLFAMTDMLQSAAGLDDTNEVLLATVAKLLPGFSGALYVLNNSRDRLDLSLRWGAVEDASVDHLAPTSCWALKRGKPHLNAMDAGSLRCRHVSAAQNTLEIPMAARGELYGLLEIGTEGPDASVRLTAIQPVASAIADAMSLALSSLALRERLRNQALRDSLTGLYNRRFLEEMLDRMCQDAERRKISIAAIMIDLDHFKLLNDQHGHAAGDAVLRDVSAAILSCLRGTDVACRYGGEELAILLPGCTAALASGKAELIRSRIAEVTAAAGHPVTASLGVAAIPESATGAIDLLPNADAALYSAKHEGRDRVVVAPTRGSSQRPEVVNAKLLEPVSA